MTISDLKVMFLADRMKRKVFGDIGDEFTKNMSERLEHDDKDDDKEYEIMEMKLLEAFESNQDRILVQKSKFGAGLYTKTKINKGHELKGTHVMVPIQDLKQLKKTKGLTTMNLCSVFETGKTKKTFVDNFLIGVGQFANHCCKEYNGILLANGNLRIIEDLEPGVEILVNYGPFYFYETNKVKRIGFKCRCDDCVVENRTPTKRLLYKKKNLAAAARIFKSVQKQKKINSIANARKSKQ
jgi:hypothetical protein